MTSTGVGPDPEKIAAMTAWHVPTTLKQLKGFLCLTRFSKKFVHHYASIAQPLTELLKKDSFHWTEAATIAFQKLKQAMIEPLVLALPNFSQDFILETDAFGVGMGVVRSHPKWPSNLLL